MIERLRKMLADGHDDPMLRFGLGNAYYQQRDYNEAIDHLVECVRQDPHYSAAWRTLGRVCMDAGLPDMARRVFEEGLMAAEESGDKQVEKEIRVFLKKLDKASRATSD